MSTRLRIVVSLLLLLGLSPVFAANYQVVVKKTGKIVSGEYARETEEVIYLKQNGLTLQFKKADLDLERMAVLNAPKPAPHPASSSPAVVSQREPTLADMARKNKESYTGTAVAFTEGDHPISPPSYISDDSSREEKEAKLKAIQTELEDWEYSKELIERSGKQLSGDNLATIERLREQARLAQEEVDEGPAAVSRHELEKEAASLKTSIQETESNLVKSDNEADKTRLNEYNARLRYIESQLDSMDRYSNSEKASPLLAVKKPASAPQTQSQPAAPATHGEKSLAEIAEETKRTHTNKARVYTEADTSDKEPEKLVPPASFQKMTPEQQQIYIEHWEAIVSNEEYKVEGWRNSGAPVLVMEKLDKQLEADRRQLEMLRSYAH